MARTKKIKEIVNEAVTEVVEKPVKKPKAKTFHLWVKLNDKVHETDTDNLDEAIVALKPEILYTALHMKITKNGKTVDKYLYLKDARRFFTNSLTRFVFIKNLDLLF